MQYSEIRTVDEQLTVGAASDSVEVVASLEGLNRANAEVGEVVDTKQMQELPISGRNWAELALLANGAVNYSDGSQRNVRFNGHSLDDGNITLDGIDATGVQEQTMKSDTRLAVAIDAISEFRVTTAVYTAESGAAGGAQINVISKTGTNNLHGSGFYAVRNDALDSRSPFDGATLPPFTLNQFGASLGGPIMKNKLFFFTNFEGLNQHLGHTFQNTVPNARVPRAGSGGVARDGAADQSLSDRRSSHRRHHEQSRDPGEERFDPRRLRPCAPRLPPHRQRLDVSPLQHRQRLCGYSVGCSRLALRGAGDSTERRRAVPEADFADPDQRIQIRLEPRQLSQLDGYGTAPVATSPFSFDGLSSNSLDTEVGTTLSFIDNVTKIVGRHTFKAGIEIRRVMLDNSGNTITTQSITYASDQDFINNAASAATYLQGEGIAHSRHTMYMGYAQDEFKVTPRLTLNLGLRYEFYSVVHELDNHSAVVDITGCGGFCPPGTPYYCPQHQRLRAASGHRLGARYSFTGKTTIRTGFGIYYGANQNDDFSDPAESFVPRYSLTNADFPALSFPLTTAFLNPANQLYSPKAIARDRKDEYYQQLGFHDSARSGRWLCRAGRLRGIQRNAHVRQVHVESH